MQNMIQATADYEAWLSGCVKLYKPDLDYKHRLMASEAESFPFFRGTYYRWAQHWQHTAADVRAAPIVPSVGDLHIENFGTWRDAEGRLIWGVNDLDEADYLPYTHDLARLAASVWFVRRQLGLTIKLSETCHLLLRGYRTNLQQGGSPFVLEEKHPELRTLALNADRDPAKFWAKLTKLLIGSEAELPASAKQALLLDLPDPALKPQFRFRPQIGMGSLGKPRYVALVEWAGGWIAREAKATTPPATQWLAGSQVAAVKLSEILANRSVRCADPFYRPAVDWITRRLAPRCSRIDLVQLTHAQEIALLLQAMGGETANMHLADRSAAALVLADLDKRGESWLEGVAHELAKQIECDWHEWQESYRAM
jgi:hypothetical protein